MMRNFGIFPTGGEPSEREKRVIFSKYLAIATHTLFSLHTCTFMGEIFMQLSGTPIGLSISGSSANICLAKVSRTIKSVLMNNSVESFLSTLYIHDDRKGTSGVKLGFEYNKDTKLLE